MVGLPALAQYPGGSGGGYGNYYGTWTQEDVVITIFGKFEPALLPGQTGSITSGSALSMTGKLGYVTASFSSPTPNPGEGATAGRACDALFACTYNFALGAGGMPPSVGITITNSSYAMSSGTVNGSAVIGNPYAGTDTNATPSGNWTRNSAPKNYLISGSSCTALTGKKPYGYTPPAGSVGDPFVGHVASGYSTTAISMTTSILANFSDVIN
ncbi:hypothetical protein [Armatimonas sp.]|uniref:hypothetical protein n=1 Tax=Armatimonas sp. TaxID=1872638 RepID=UPI0037518425